MNKLHNYVQEKLVNTERKLVEMMNDIIAEVVEEIYETEREYKNAYEELVAEIKAGDDEYLKEYVRDMGLSDDNIDSIFTKTKKGA